MIILAVDTSCDDSCVAIIDTEKWTLLADIVHSHVDSMRQFGGIVPEIASREHLKALPLALHEALSKAKLSLKDIDWFAVTNRPGLIGALLVGVSFTKTLAFSLNRPFSVINHIEAHLFSPFLLTLEGGTTPPFPWIALVVSGGHTEMFLVKGLMDYKWLGGTLDDAAGEAFDKVGKLLNLPYPAGPKIDAWVLKSANESHYRFRFPRAKTDSCTFSFSGLKTAVSLQVKKLEAVGITDDDKLTVCASAQEAILEPLVAKLQEAQSAYGIKQVVVTGGVACNKRLRKLLPDAYFPKPAHCTDNAAMVAVLAGLYAKENRLISAPLETTAQASLENL